MDDDQKRESPEKTNLDDLTVILLAIGQMRVHIDHVRVHMVHIETAISRIRDRLKKP